MKRPLFLIPVLILITIGGVSIYHKVDRFFRARPVKNEDALRSKIVASIDIPFDKGDTLILSSIWMFCGNSDRDKLPVVFDTKLEDETFKALLAKRIKKPVLTESEFGKIMNTILQVRFHGKYPASLWDTCRVGKVSARIKAEQMSPRHVRLYEDYLYGNSGRHISKDFAFDGSTWTYSINDTSSYVNDN